MRPETCATDMTEFLEGDLGWVLILAIVELIFYIQAKEAAVLVRRLTPFFGWRGGNKSNQTIRRPRQMPPARGQRRRCLVLGR
jgi:hypothetical protein